MVKLPGRTATSQLPLMPSPPGPRTRIGPCGMELGPWQSCVDRLATTPGQAALLHCDAVAVLEARAALLAAAGRRAWEISPHTPALIVIIDEYAELADEAPGAMSDADSIVRLGRAVAVPLQNSSHGA